MFLHWIFKGLAFLILRLLLKRIDLVLSFWKWMLSLLNCKMSIVKNSNQHYNHKRIKLLKRNFTEVCVNFNIELWFLQSYQNSNFWRTMDWLIPRMPFFHLEDVIHIPFFQLDFLCNLFEALKYINVKYEPIPLMIFRMYLN